MFSASAKKVRLRNNPFTLTMTIWGFPVVKLHAAVLVSSIEPVAFCHPFCPGCNVSVLPALPKYCTHDISGSASHGFGDLKHRLETLCTFSFISPMVSTLHHLHTAGAHAVSTGSHVHRMQSLPAKF